VVAPETDVATGATAGKIDERAGMETDREASRRR
jgi:hypothetical protein